MYSTPTRGGTPLGSKRNAIPDGPISDFAVLVEETPPDRWQRRCTALRDLVDMIPEGASYSQNGQAWYNSPPTLRHLSYPVGDLLKDPRSTVVKRTCESLTRLFIKCQTDARYLFKDLMPTILSVHAQTVQIIRTAVQDMVMETIPEVPCKMVMPLWMDRLKIDKSRTVRDACALYLGQALQSWTEDGYLTPEIWMQVGMTLMRTLRDPSPQVRKNAKDALEYMRAAQPQCWENLVNDEEGPVARDLKLQRWLKSLGKPESPDAEELSVASKFSYNSDTRYVVRTSGGGVGGGIGSTRGSPAANVPRGAGGRLSGGSALSSSDHIPMSINVNAEPTTHPPPVVGQAQQRPKGGGLGPPMRMAPPAGSAAPPFPQAMIDSPAPPPPPPPTPPPQKQAKQQQQQQQPSPAAALESPLRPIAAGTPPRHPTPSNNFQKSPKTCLNSAEDKDDSSSHPDLESNPSFPSDLNHAFNHQAGTGSEKSQNQNQKMPADDGTPAMGFSIDEGPFIASMQELKKHASKRRSRNSIMMQERFRMSGSLIDGDDDNDDNEQVFPGKSEEENEVPNNDGAMTPLSAAGGAVASTSAASAAASKASSASAPEHMVIAIRLLRAHKAHVDAIMETLKIEMDTLRDFDRLLEEPGRPYEEEVLDYFESVGLCLDQRTQAGSALQREMDRISRGEPPQE